MGLLFSECFLFTFDFGKVLILFVGKKKHFQAFLQNSQSVETFACFHGMEAPQTHSKKMGVHNFKVGFDQCWVGITNIFGYHPDITRASQSDLFRVSS
jgi:hypothetical protein